MLHRCFIFGQLDNGCGDLVPDREVFTKTDFHGTPADCGSDWWSMGMCFCGNAMGTCGPKDHALVDGLADRTDLHGLCDIS